MSPCVCFGLLQNLHGASCRDRDGRTDVYLAYSYSSGMRASILDLGNLAAAVCVAVGPTPEYRLPAFFLFSFFCVLVNLDLDAMRVSLRCCTWTGSFPAGRDASSDALSCIRAICTMTLHQVTDGIRGPMGEVDTMATLVSRSLNSAILVFRPRDERELSKGAKAKSGDFERYEDMKLAHHWNGYGREMTDTPGLRIIFFHVSRPKRDRMHPNRLRS